MLKRATWYLEKTERCSELAECWESMFYLATAWERELEAKEAGRGWKGRMPNSGGKFGAHEEAILEDPRSFESWGDFAEVEKDYDTDVSDWYSLSRQS